MNQIVLHPFQRMMGQHVHNLSPLKKKKTARRHSLSPAKSLIIQ
jgi:hypothetical protein